MAISPIRPTDDEARDLARSLIAAARHAALGVLHPDTGLPFVTRVALGQSPDGAPLTLISSLALHTRALRASPMASLLIGEPPAKGDPLAFPRLTLTATASFIERGGEEHEKLRRHYLVTQPKAKLYIDFADFSFVCFRALTAALNGGFGKAYELGPDDLE